MHSSYGTRAPYCHLHLYNFEGVKGRISTGRQLCTSGRISPSATVLVYCSRMVESHVYTAAVWWNHMCIAVQPYTVWWNHMCILQPYGGITCVYCSAAVWWNHMCILQPYGRITCVYNVLRSTVLYCTHIQF